MTRYIHARRLTVFQQKAGLVATGFAVDIQGTRLIARGSVRPTNITDRYDVRLEYRQGGYPAVFVERPALARRPEQPDEPIPHTYDSATPGKEQPCVYFPDTDWDSTMSLARSVIPWLQCWLVDYECWRATGVWSGGGIPHRGAKRSSRRAR